MKLKQRIGKIPDGNTPLPNQPVAIRKVSTGETIDTLFSDSAGFITLQRDGHLEPYYLHLQGVPGGDKFWDSRDSHHIGVISPRELPYFLRALGVGVIRGYSSELAVSLVSGGPSVSVAPGAALVAGHPECFYGSTVLANSRPVSGTRIDRVVIRLFPEGSSPTPGKADLALLQGTPDAGAPSLTQTADLYEVSLYQVIVPAAGSTSLIDERSFAGETPPVSGEVRSSAVTTTNGSGEALSGLNIPLTLSRNAAYDIIVTLFALHDNAVGWVLQATYGSFGSGTSPNFSSPAQVAIDSSGNIYIADTGNNRLVKLDSSGAYVASITSLTSITGVCLDASDNVYVTVNPGGMSNTTKKYNSSLALQWTASPSSSDQYTNVATDGTLLYTTLSTPSPRIAKSLCSTGAFVMQWGSAGSGNGQFSGPYGICYNSTDSLLYVVDAGNSRVQVFNTSGVYQRQWAIDANARGIAADASGDIWVAFNGTDVLKRYSSTGVLQDTIAQADPDGIAVASGDVLWVSNAGSHTIAKWDEAAAGYGLLAIDIGGGVSSYVGPGDRLVATGNVAVGTASGPGTVTIRAFGKATSGTATFRSVVLSVRAVPRA